MVDAFQNNIKKVRVKPENLPPILITTDGTTLGQYYFRYRVVSEDGAKRSAWTPVQTINARDFTSVSVSLNIVSDGTKFMLSWTSPDIYMTQYDVYVSWYPDPEQSGEQYTPYQYVGRATGNSFVIDIPGEYQSEDGSKLAKFVIQLPTSPQVLNTPAQIFLSSTGVSTETTPVDGGVV
jgi:hypothetical protein